jgi:hypothetical protein
MGVLLRLSAMKAHTFATIEKCGHVDPLGDKCVYVIERAHLRFIKYAFYKHLPLRG